jgi:glucosylceramidase
MGRSSAQGCLPRGGLKQLAAAGRLRGLLPLAACLCLWGAWASPALGQAPRPVQRFPVSVWVTTSDLRQAMRRHPALQSSAHPGALFPLVSVNAGARFQPYRGIGGAMTDSSAWLLEEELPPQQRDEWLNALFSRQGAGLGFIRVPMGASDFTLGGIPYSYDDMPLGQSDPGLAHFSIIHDLAYVIPALRDALRVNRHPFILATPWSPPAWMKANQALNNLGKRGAIFSSDLPWLAGYFARFLRAYARQGVRVSAITPQNEPSVSSNYPGAQMPANQEAAFITRNLAPSLRRAGLSGVRIYGYDGSWGNYPWDLVTSSVARDLAGISWHCYVNSPDMMRRFHGYQPGLDEIVGECATPPRASTAEILITAFRDWASSVALWNLALDQDGGPVIHPNITCNGCTGILTVNTATHTAQATLDFWQLAQVGHFVRPGARRIDSSTFVTQDINPPTTYGINDVAFENPDGQRVLVAYNNAATARPFTVGDSGQYFSYRLAPDEMATFTWRVSGRR